MKDLTNKKTTDAIPEYHNATQLQLQHFHDAVQEDASMDFSKFHKNNDPGFNLYLNPQVVPVSNFGIVNYIRSGSPKMYQAFLKQLPMIKESTRFISDGGTMVPTIVPAHFAEDSPQNRLRYTKWLIASHDHFLRENGLFVSDEAPKLDSTTASDVEGDRIVLPSWYSQINATKYAQMFRSVSTLQIRKDSYTNEDKRDGIIKYKETPQGRRLSLSSPMSSFISKLPFVPSAQQRRDIYDALSRIYQEADLSAKDAVEVAAEIAEAYSQNPDNIEAFVPRVASTIKRLLETDDSKSREIAIRIMGASFKVLFTYQKEIERERRVNLLEMATAPRGAGLEASKTEYAEATGKQTQVFESAGFGGSLLTLHGRGNRAKTAADLLIERKSTQSR